ncbi:unnamed protein product [Cyprideis torosa]|uniref:WW domain binding protein VOPP1 n=1 Tax=Cyprideis torosa TaxID=163714 RepID=A0A7R8W9T5_9CRUS|nr:unnamed protein product [Cyprideis torosa]CAG0885676.1 unnamed protein product [Cyprideis torosa]
MKTCQGFLENLHKYILLLAATTFSQLIGCDASYCVHVENGEIFRFYCDGFHRCCGRGCCVSPAFSMYRLWYFWIFFFMTLALCSGGGWWYRGRTRAMGLGRGASPYGWFARGISPSNHEERRRCRRRQSSGGAVDTSDSTPPSSSGNVILTPHGWWWTKDSMMPVGPAVAPPPPYSATIQGIYAGVPHPRPSTPPPAYSEAIVNNNLGRDNSSFEVDNSQSNSQNHNATTLTGSDATGSSLDEHSQPVIAPVPLSTARLPPINQKTNDNSEQQNQGSSSASNV